MKVNSRGYFTKNRKMEKSAIYFTKKVAKKIFKGYSQVKEIKITFLKNQIEWTYGYHWIWNPKNGSVEIVIPGGYRGLYRSKWLIVHEMFHARQRIEGRLNKSLLRVVYENKRFFWSRTKKEFVDSKGKVFKNPPWEIEVRRRSGKIFGKKNTDLAWGS